MNEYEMLADAVTPFPKRFKAEPSDLRTAAKLRWRFADCSDGKFLCVDVVTDGTSAIAEPLRIAVPRSVVVNRTYVFGRVRGLVFEAVMLRKRPTAQIVLWQNFAGRDIAVKLTVQQGRGVVFIDGINFWNRQEFELAETCALESPKGWFSSIKVAPYPYGEPIE